MGRAKKWRRDISRQPLSLLEEKHQEKASDHGNQADKPELTIRQSQELAERRAPLARDKQRHQPLKHQNQAKSKKQRVHETQPKTGRAST